VSECFVGRRKYMAPSARPIYSGLGSYLTKGYTQGSSAAIAQAPVAERPFCAPA
jgi:hypothetical protein